MLVLVMKIVPMVMDVMMIVNVNLDGNDDDIEDGCDYSKWAFDHSNSDQENDDFRLLAACNQDDYGNDDDDDIAAG